MPATLALDSIDPVLKDTVNIEGVCSATWTETQRNPNSSRAVNAHITSGACSDNQWTVTIDPDTLSALDNLNAANMLSLVPD
jgi:hypothetical protein